VLRTGRSQIGNQHLLVFGGLNKRERYSDVWVLSLEDRVWTKVDVQGQGPEARAHFTATRFGQRIFIFGGYGGSGQVYNDMWVLHFGGEEGYVWEDITAKIEGTGPTPRFDHSAFIYPITPNSETYDKLLIMGGRDLSQMWQDSHMLDLASMAWENDTQPPCLPYEICNNVCDGIESVPYHKVFSFGGKKGMMQYVNAVEVMDCGSQVWSTPPTDHGVAPCGREDTAWVFDVKTCCLLIFGGWANRWLGDTLKLNVSPIIGPPYACTNIEPDGGPVFGTTELVVKGLRFKDGNIKVKFGTK
jgi:dynein heavy chain